MLIDHWPLVALRVRTARLEMRLPTEPELAELADLAATGITGPGHRTHAPRWAERPAAERARSVVQGHWRGRGTWTPDEWSLELAVLVRGQPVGVQEVSAHRFRVLRNVNTSSWLGLEHQGRGIGAEMHAAALRLVFDGLGAHLATMTATTDNAPALALARRVGYHPAGVSRDLIQLGLTRRDWERTDRPEVTITGLKECRWQFGA